ENATLRERQGGVRSHRRTGGPLIPTAPTDTRWTLCARGAAPVYRTDGRARRDVCLIGGGDGTLEILRSRRAAEAATRGTGAARAVPGTRFLPRAGEVLSAQGCARTGRRYVEYRFTAAAAEPREIHRSVQVVSQLLPRR